MTESSSPSYRRIKPLDSTVVNRIAAGEIVVAPVNALKELLENSIDAGSTSIDVLTKDDGFKLLQITDNGMGIHQADLGILCNRFTTSKLTSFDDLNSIATYGFRGEALASISHVSHLSVISKTRDDITGYKAKYRDGEMISEVTRTASRNGTQITVEDLFFNMPLRLKTFRSKGRSDEYNKIVDIVARYAIHTHGIAFSCKRVGDSTSALAVSRDLSTKDKIRVVYGSTIANELMEITECSAHEIGIVKLSGYITNANYSSKKSITPILFINHRYVSHDPLRRTLKQLYATYLQKGGHPFVYLSIEIEPANVDVNVHPTKREVRFLHEEEVINFIWTKIESLLKSVDSSRTYKTQTLISGGVSQFKEFDSQPSQMKRVYENRLVRTDPNQAKLTIFAKETSNVNGNESDNLKKDLSSRESNEIIVDTTQLKEYRVLKLTSIKRLRRQVEASLHKSLTQVFANHSFVGIVDYRRRLAAIQYDVNLYLVDYGAVCNELFYQLGLSAFANFGQIEFSEKIPINSLLEASGCSMKEIEEINSLLADEQRRNMLSDYFSCLFLQTTEGTVLKSLPLLLKDYSPSLSKLPLFLKRLLEINWDDEMLCLDGILHELSYLYIPISIDNEGDQTEKMAAVLEKTIFPTLKNRLVATYGLEPYVIEIASLPGLYKVFERC